MTPKRAILTLKVVLWVSASAPALWMIAGLRLGWLGVNPIEKLTHVSGMTTLVLLLVTLSVSPLRRLTGWNPIIKLRRPLGLFAYAYGVGHFSIWFAFDMVFNVQWMIEDIVLRKYITVGMTALLILTPLTVTSTTGWIRRLGKRWAKLHQGVYIATGLGCLHFFWLVKADTRLPLLLATCFAILLVLRHPRLTGKGRLGKGPRGKGRTSPTRSPAPG